MQGIKPPTALAKDTSTADRIRTSARKLFYENGYQASSVGEIAKAAGVSRATIYLHFRTRDDILFEILKEDMRDQLQHFDRLAALPQVNKTAIKKWLLALQKAMDAHRASINLFVVAFDLSKELKASADRHRDAAIMRLGVRFKGFDLAAFEPDQRAAQRIKCYFMLFLIESASITFSSGPAAPGIDAGADQLAEMLLYFMNEGEIRTDIG